MDYTEFVQSLMEARRRAQMQGRPASAEETAAATQPVIQEQGARELQSRALNTEFDRLAHERWLSQQKLKQTQRDNMYGMIGKIWDSGMNLMKKRQTSKQGE